MQNFKRRVEDINTLLKQPDRKRDRASRIPPELTILAGNVFGSHLCNILNLDVENCLFRKGLKTATVGPIYIKKSKHEKVKL